MNVFSTTWADRFAFWLPILSALLSVGAGLAALAHYDQCAAGIGIMAGCVAACGVYATGRASKIRDDQMAFWINATSDSMAQPPTGF